MLSLNRYRRFVFLMIKVKYRPFFMMLLVLMGCESPVNMTHRATLDTEPIHVADNVAYSKLIPFQPTLLADEKGRTVSISVIYKNEYNVRITRSEKGFEISSSDAAVTRELQQILQKYGFQSGGSSSGYSLSPTQDDADQRAGVVHWGTDFPHRASMHMYTFSGTHDIKLLLDELNNHHSVSNAYATTVGSFFGFGEEEYVAQ